MISIKRQPLANFNSRKYVISWLKKERHGAEDKATAMKCHTSAISKSLFFILAQSQIHQGVFYLSGQLDNHYYSTILLICIYF